MQIRVHMVHRALCDFYVSFYLSSLFLAEMARTRARAKTFATKLLPRATGRATSRDRGYCALFSRTFLSFESYNTDPSSIYYVILREKFLEILAAK